MRIESSEVHMKSAFILIGCLVCLSLSNTSPAPPCPSSPREEFVAIGNMPSVTGSEMVGPGATINVSIYLDSYSTDAEARAMASQFSGGGYKALRKALEKATLKGRITVSGREGSYDLKLLRSTTTDGGRRIFAVGERPIRFLDAYYSGRTHDEQFGILQLELKTTGRLEEGSGVLVHGGRIKGLEADTITLEDSTFEPVRLAGVRRQTLIPNPSPRGRRAKYGLPLPLGEGRGEGLASR